MCFSFPPNDGHDAFMHHTMHVAYPTPLTTTVAVPMK